MKLSKMVAVCNGVNFMKKEIADNGGLVILSAYKDTVDSFEKTVKTLVEEGYKKIIVAIKDGSKTYQYDVLCDPKVSFIEAYKKVGTILG